MIGAIAEDMSGKPKRFSVPLCNSTLRRNVIAVDVVAQTKVAAAQIAKRKRLNFAEMPLVIQKERHGAEGG